MSYHTATNLKEVLSLMSKSITQDMRYRQSLMQYAAKYGVSRASRKYNKSRSYIYFWKARWDGSVESLVCQSRQPHSHPNQHTEAELKLIQDMRRRNPNLGMVELWNRLKLQQTAPVQKPPKKARQPPRRKVSMTQGKVYCGTGWPSTWETPWKQRK